jgi:hypothetical protein
MVEPREFFDQLMTPFTFHPILEFAFSGGTATKQGVEFINTLFYNMFIAAPTESI